MKSAGRSLHYCLLKNFTVTTNRDTFSTLFQNWNDPTVNVDLELHSPSVYQDNRLSAPSSVRITLGTGEIEQKVNMVIQDVVPPVDDTVQQIKMVLQQSGGSNTLSRIGRGVRKPKSRKLVKIVRKYPRDFVVRRLQPSGELLVELVTQKKKGNVPANVVPAHTSKQEMNAMEQESHTLKRASLAVNDIVHDIIGSFQEQEINDLSNLQVIIGSIAHHPNHAGEPMFVGIDFRYEFPARGEDLPRTFLDIFVGKTKFIFACPPALALGQCPNGLRALLSQKETFFIIGNPQQLWDQPFLASGRHPDANFNLLDSQLVAEYLFQEPYLEWETILDNLLKLRVPTAQLNEVSEKNRMHLFFHLLWEEMHLNLGEKDIASLQIATRNRVLDSQQGRYRYGFDSANGYSKHSSTLASMVKENPSDLVGPQDFLSKVPLQEVNDFCHLFDYLPPRLLTLLDTCYPNAEQLKETVTEIVLDLGRSPYLWAGGRRVFFCEKPEPLVVDEEDIAHILDKCRFPFGPDNRAALPGQLHRIAAMRDRNGKIYGLTMQFGRHIQGNAGLILDILHGSTKSVLILGPPGSGKTTLIREIARVLSEGMITVVIVDPSNEIGGDGAQPHACIGLARRMMVPSLEQQGSVMVECVQNHTPHIMIVDEIGRSNEVLASGTVKSRGVRLVASAHGDLRGLVANSDLNGLIGGVQAVTLGDALAIHRASGLLQASKVGKIVTQRVGPPIFDVIIELDRNNKYAWKVITEPGQAVDAILNGDHYSYELRSRNPETFEMSLVPHTDG